MILSSMRKEGRRLRPEQDMTAKRKANWRRQQVFCGARVARAASSIFKKQGSNCFTTTQKLWKLYTHDYKKRSSKYNIY